MTSCSLLHSFMFGLKYSSTVLCTNVTRGLQEHWKQSTRPEGYETTHCTHHQIQIYIKNGDSTYTYKHVAPLFQCPKTKGGPRPRDLIVRGVEGTLLGIKLIGHSICPLDGNPATQLLRCQYLYFYNSKASKMRVLLY